MSTLAVKQHLWHMQRTGHGRIIKVKKSIHIAAALAASLALAACASGPKGVRITNDGTSATSAMQGETIRTLSAGEIAQRITGKTFQYTRNDGNGFVTYNADGTFDFQDDQRGEGKGRWSASGNQYCETFGAGKPQECGVFKNTGDAYFAANSRLVEMKV